MFRRTRALGLYRAGVELETVFIIRGHLSTQTTRIYATPSLDMMREAMGISVISSDYKEEEWLTDGDELSRLCGFR